MNIFHNISIEHSYIDFPLLASTTYLVFSLKKDLLYNYYSLLLIVSSTRPDQVATGLVYKYPQSLSNLTFIYIQYIIQSDSHSLLIKYL